MFEYLLGMIATFYERKSFQLSKKQAQSEVVSSLKSALRLTERHIADTRQGEFGEVEFTDFQSKEISAAWSRVALAIRPFDKDLAQNFEDKSDYWIDPNGFRNDIQDGQRRFDYRFRLAEVKKELVRIENTRI